MAATTTTGTSSPATSTSSSTWARKAGTPLAYFAYVDKSMSRASDRAGHRPRAASARRSALPLRAGAGALLRAGRPQRGVRRAHRRVGHGCGDAPAVDSSRNRRARRSQSSCSRDTEVPGIGIDTIGWSQLIAQFTDYRGDTHHAGGRGASCRGPSADSEPGAVGVVQAVNVVSARWLFTRELRRCFRARWASRRRRTKFAPHRGQQSGARTFRL